MKRYICGSALFMFGALLLINPSHAATSLPFTINLSEAVTVTGTPRIAIDVGGTTRYATYTSGTGTNALVFTYTIVSGDVDNDGITISSPIQLNGGTIDDLSGNNATLTFVPPNTTNVRIDASPPSGYTASFVPDTITNVNKTNVGFTLNYNKINKTYNYSITSSNGGTPVTGTGTTTGVLQTINGIDVTSLPDGKLTLSVFVSDSVGGTGTILTSTAPKALLDAGLIGHWTFDTSDISGTTAFDRSGQGHNGTLNNGPTTTTGKIGGALNFDGADDFVESTPSVGATATFAFWATWSGANNKMPFAMNTNNPGPDIFFTGGTICWNTYDSGGNPFSSIPASASNGNPHLYVMVISATSTVLYYDGVNIGAAAYRTPTAALLQIGGHATYRWPGKIDDFRIYNRALTSIEVATLYGASN